MSFETPNELYKAGILFSIITDSPVVPQQYLSLSAALAAKAGLPEYEAIKAITINPAKILGLDNRVGSIKEGKDADFVICTKNILDTQNEIKNVYINGKKVAEGEFSNIKANPIEQVVHFPITKGNQIRLVATRIVDNKKQAGIGEFSVITEK